MDGSGIPNDGSMYQEDSIDERQEEENKERADTQSSFPVLDQIITTLREDIAKAEVEAARMLNVGMSEMDLKGIISGTQRYKDNLQTTLNNLEYVKGEYIK